MLRPSGMHCVPRTASSLFWTSPRPASRPPAPSSAPTPVFPVRILPAGWWPGAEWGRPPRQDGYDLGHGNCDLHVLIPRIVLLVCAGSGGLEFGFSFFSLLILLFQKWDIDQNCSVCAWNWTERLWNSCGGQGGCQQPNRCAVSGPVFIFKNRQMRQWSLSPPRRGDLWPPSPHHPPSKPLCLALKTPEFFVHLQPSSSSSSPVAGLCFRPSLSDPCISYYVRYHLPEKRPCADY